MRSLKSFSRKLFMNVVNRTFRLLFAVLVVFQVGCASVNRAPDSDDSEAKKFVSKPGISQVYVYRNEILGAALSMPVTVNGIFAGSTGPKSFFKFDLSPGQHVFASQGDVSKLTIITEPSKNYFVWQEVKMGVWSGNSKLQLVSEDVGRKGVLESVRLDSALRNEPRPTLPVSSESKAPAIGISAPSLSDPASAASPPTASTRIPYISDLGQTTFREYLLLPTPKAFAISKTGIWRYAHLYSDKFPNRSTDPKLRAIENCQDVAKTRCELYAVDNDVTFRTRIGEGERAMLKRLNDVQAVPNLSDKGREVYRTWLTRPFPRAFAIASNGWVWGAFGAKPADPTLPADVTERAKKGCENVAGMECVIYAVDEQVVLNP
jgi:hypothetical protein